MTFVKNALYDTTTYIYSLWLSRNLINTNVILLHADLLYEPVLLKKVIDSNRSCVLVNKERKIPDKDFKAEINTGFVRRIGINVSGEERAFCLPIYKFLYQDYRIFIKEIEKFIQNKRVLSYAEDALNEIIKDNKIELFPVEYSSELGMEIDDYEDLDKARGFIAQK